MKKPIISFNLMTPSAFAPVLATPGSMCWDILSPRDVIVSEDFSAVVETGLRFAIPEGWAIKVHSRSGHGFKHDVRLANCTGLIDTDYRGQLKVKLTKDSSGTLTVPRGQAICQIEIVKVNPCYMVALDDEQFDTLPQTERGEGGFGSTDMQGKVGSTDAAGEQLEMPV